MTVGISASLRLSKEVTGLKESSQPSIPAKLTKNAFFRVLETSRKIFSLRYELLRDSQESMLGMVVCKLILLVFSGGDSL